MMTGQGNNNGQREADQPEKFWGAEIKRDLSQISGKEDKRDVGDKIGDLKGSASVGRAFFLLFGRKYL